MKLVLVMLTPEFTFSPMLVIMTLFCSTQSQPTACETGWFGLNCQNKCWCPANKCRPNGACANGAPCVAGQFGPSCQYRNLMFRATSAEAWLNDGVVGTCNLGTPLVTADLGFSYHLSWLRIVFNASVKSPVSPALVVLQFTDADGGPVECYNRTDFDVDPKTVDIRCNISTTIKTITVSGNDTFKMCELFVNGDYAERLSNFLLQLLDVNDTVVENYQEPGKNLQVYRVPLWTSEPAYKVKVQATSVLTVCELETFGEPICPPFKWGIDCLDDCRCTENELCSPVTGQCDAQCPHGFYKPLCDHTCPKNCLSSRCSRQTGICVNCQEGYTGIYCDLDCAPDTYGGNCRLTCPSSCRARSCKNNVIDLDNPNDCSDRLCNHNGMCYACKDPTRYGPNCTLECPNNCQPDSCDIINGTCLICKVGFYGEDCSQACSEYCKDTCDLGSGVCDECKGIFYGDNCSVPCPEACPTCDDITGSCTSCPKGFYGENCSDVCPQNCREDICNVTNGSCLNGCETGLFGRTCSLRCPRRCNPHGCEASNGSCYTCANGFYGLRCDFLCPDDCSSRVCNIHTGACAQEANSLFATILPFIVGACCSFTLIGLLLRGRINEKGEDGGTQSQTFALKYAQEC